MDENNNQKGFDILGLLGIICCIVGLFVAGIPLGCVAVLFGIIGACFKTNNSPMDVIAIIWGAINITITLIGLNALANMMILF